MSSDAHRRGVYPGSFNPPTTAHLAISEAALDAHDLDEVVWSISRVALAKEQVSLPRFEHRLEVLDEISRRVDWLTVAVTDAQLLVDIAVGFDVLIMGADKWHQIQDPIFYDDDPLQRDAAMAALPTLAVAPRPPLDIPSDLELAVPHWAHDVSSTEARAGSHSMMVTEASTFDQRTGAWTDDERYQLWLAEHEQSF
jgi:hypothetical protein